MDWGERLISTKSGRNALEVAGIPPLKPPMTPGRDGTGNGSGKRSAGLAVFKRGLNRHLHPQDPPPASSPPHVRAVTIIFIL